MLLLSNNKGHELKIYQSNIPMYSRVAIEFVLNSDKFFSIVQNIKFYIQIDVGENIVNGK